MPMGISSNPIKVKLIPNTAYRKTVLYFLFLHMTREQLSEIIGYAPRHIQAIENEGKYPSIELFIQLIQMFDVSVDEYIFPDKEVKKSSVRRRLDAQLDKLDDKELSVIEATVNGLCKAKEPEE